MIDTSKRLAKEQQKDKIRKRMHASVDPANYEYIPEKKRADYYDNEVHHRVGIYVRVSTDDIRQTTSFELQRKYYEDFVSSHPNWELAGIYADEGISGTSLKHRDAFNQMIADAKAGKLDLIITKSVSRFARNVMITIGMARDLAHLDPPVGIFFESECIFSLNDDSQMALTFQATMAEEESHTRSRSMETSLRMRLDNGIPLTPKLLGYTHDADGNLIINPEEAGTVKLAFFMYLYGYSTRQIADAFNALERRSYFGNVNWTSSGIVQILRNERHCGDVLTRKTYTEDYRTHRKLKNRGNRPQSRYLNHHEAIISRDDFIAVQKLLDNAKYKNKSLLPQLKVIDSGLLKGFVTINPRWAGFQETEYYQASLSVYQTPEDNITPDDLSTGTDVLIQVSAGDLDLRGFEIARTELFESTQKPYITFYNSQIKFSAACVRHFGAGCTAELLIHPLRKQFALRPAGKDNRNSITISKKEDLLFQPKPISCAAFSETIFTIMDWKKDCRYTINGTLYTNEDEFAYVFRGEDAEAFFKSNSIPLQSKDGGTQGGQPLLSSRNRIKAIPAEWVDTFGKPYYLHEDTFKAISEQDQASWKLKIESQLFETGKKLSITPYEKLKAYIMDALGPLAFEEVDK